MRACVCVCAGVRESESGAAGGGGGWGGAVKKSALPRDSAKLWRRQQPQLLASSCAHQLRPHRRPAAPGEGACAGFGSASGSEVISLPSPAPDCPRPNFHRTAVQLVSRPSDPHPELVQQLHSLLRCGHRSSDLTEKWGPILGLPVPQQSLVSRWTPMPWAASLGRDWLC